MVLNEKGIIVDYVKLLSTFGLFVCTAIAEIVLRESLAFLPAAQEFLHRLEQRNA